MYPGQLIHPITQSYGSYHVDSKNLYMLKYFHMEEREQAKW
jgi:hypothetical protein